MFLTRARMFACSAAALVAALALAPAWGADPRPCELFSPGEIASITGVAPGPGVADGPDVDKDWRATSWTCGWPAGSQYFAASVIRFASAADAARGMSEATRVSRLVPEGIRLSEASGAGDQALWGASPEGAIWIARRGPMLLAIVHAGESKPPAALREPMRRLLSSALGRLR